jgi:hypothetical protein
MNERIKELALEAGGSHYPDVNSKQLEYFAKLIIKECCRIADKGAEPRGMPSDGIQKYFGINND